MVVLGILLGFSVAANIVFLLTCWQIMKDNERLKEEIRRKDEKAELLRRIRRGREEQP